MYKLIYLLAALLILPLAGCSVNPSLTYEFQPLPKMENVSPVKKIVIMKPFDDRGHAGTTPCIKAYIPFYPYVREIRTPEAFTYEWNANRFDYEMDFAELLAADLRAAGLAVEVTTSPEISKISPLLSGAQAPDYIIRLKLNRLDWQRKFTMYGVSIVGYVPQAFGAPDEYGYAYLKFSAEMIDSKGKTVSVRTFSATESQNGWLYYYSGYLRALTRAYQQVSPDFRGFVASSIASGTPQ